MLKEEIYKFAEENPHCFLATAEGRQPHVRGVHLYRVDGAGLVFHTGRPKPLYRQLSANCNVEFCFVRFQPLAQVRIWGAVEELFDQALKEEIVESRPFLKPLVEAGGYEGLAVFAMRSGQGSAWSMEDVMNPSPPVALFGG